MEINVNIDYPLKSLCYLQTSLSLIKCYIESTNANLITENTRPDEYLRKQYDIIVLRIERLPLPCCLRRELRCLINKEFSQIRRLFNSDLQSAISGTDFLDIRHWNLDGSLNRKSIAKSIIETADLHTNPGFILAFNYCLEEESVHYWDQMPIHERIALPYYHSPSYIGGNIFMDIYACNKRHVKDLAAFSYRLNGLNEEDKKIKEVFQIAKHRRISPEVMRFCLSLLDENQQKEICLKNPVGALRALLTWPYHHEFNKVAIFLWNNINKKLFCRVIREIVVQLGKWPDMECVQILKDFWDASPANFRSYIDNDPDCVLLLHFFNLLGSVTWNEVFFSY